MGKKYARGNRKAQRYRARIRAGNDLTVYAPWGKPLYDGRGGRPPFPPRGWTYFENQFGRGFVAPQSIRTPYDKPLSNENMGRKFPRKYKPLFVIKPAEPDAKGKTKKGTLP